MQEFQNRIQSHVEHIRKVGIYCTTEETTKQALILPLLDILGFSAFDPTKIRAEHTSDFPGAKVGERVDYALFCNGLPVMFIEAKACAQNLNNHCPQLSRYYNATPEVAVAVITNGREWRFFTDLDNKNIMDAQPFLTIDFEKVRPDTAQQLLRFHHDQYQPAALRALAEESIYLNSFKAVITSMLKDCDTEFVRYVAGRANIQRQCTAKFLELVQPLVKQAVAQSVSEMVASSLTTAPVLEVSLPASTPTPTVEMVDLNASIVSPLNPKIVTTANERRIFEICSEILTEEDIHPKDTESYFTVLFQGKNTRWLFRYQGDKKRPSIQFCIPLTDSHKAEVRRSKIELLTGDSIALDKPDHLLRLTGLLSDALAFCKNDENFKRVTSS